MARIDIDWPKNLTVTGVLSFPLTSEADLGAVKEWRTTRGIPKPKFPDKIGASLLINEKMVERVQSYMLETYFPFATELYKITDGDKGISPDDLKELISAAKKGDWSKKNLPLRELSAKERENADDDLIAKIKFGGPFEDADFKKKAIVSQDGDLVVTSIDSLVDDGILPEGHHDPARLWWGSGWWFRTSLRFNVFDTPKVGASAYGTTLYLLPERGLPTFGGNSSDADVLADGDDWSDE